MGNHSEIRGQRAPGCSLRVFSAAYKAHRCGDLTSLPCLTSTLPPRRRRRPDLPRKPGGPFKPGFGLEWGSCCCPRARGV
jgi:hypothetical protein